MKRFQYRLAPLLNYREQRVELAKAAVAMAGVKVDAAEQALARLRAELARNREESRTRLDAADLVWHLRLADGYLGCLRRQEQLQVNQLAAARQELRLRQQEAYRAEQEKQLLDKHRDRQEQAWACDLRQHEIRQLDEAAGCSFLRRTNPEPNVETIP